MSLVFPPPVTPDVQALPRLVATTPSARLINDQLALLDAEETSWATSCNTDPPRSQVERRVDVVFAGPPYLGLLILNESCCPGAAHGNHFSAPLTFDLASRTEVIWPDLFPSALQDRLCHTHRTGPVIDSERLTVLFLAQADQMDADRFDAIVLGNDGYFRVWPSAADRGLVLMPTGLAHANQACADPVVFPAALLRHEGFPAVLLEALDHPAPLSAGAATPGP